MKKALTIMTAVFLLGACNPVTGPGNKEPQTNNDNIEQQNFRGNDMNRNMRNNDRRGNDVNQNIGNDRHMNTPDNRNLNREQYNDNNSGTNSNQNDGLTNDEQIYPDDSRVR